VGAQYFVDKKDALCVFEVKGNCTATDLKRASRQSQKVRALQGASSPLYGVVCYRVAVSERTIMRRFGHAFHKATNTYIDNATIPKELESNWNQIDYPELDFFVSLESGKKIFLRRYELSPGKFRYIRDVSDPLIKSLFALVRSLWVPAHHAAPAVGP
jgi:hypothetical protein